MITPIAQKFKVFDDFISPTYQNIIEQLLLSSKFLGTAGVNGL